MNHLSVRHGSKVQRLLALLTAFILLALGCLAVWVCYAFAESGLYDPYRWAKISVAGVAAFFMLRGGLFILFPRSQYNRPVNLYSTR